MLSKLNSFFSSVKLAIFLFISIAVVSIIGTFINQGNTMAQYKIIYGAKVFATLYWLGFLNIYNSWYFIGLAALLMINLLTASINRFPRTLSAVFGPYPSFKEAAEKKSPKAVYESFESKQGIFEVVSVLKGVFGSPLKESNAPVSGEKELYYSKNSIFRFSSYIAHLSVIIIIIGVLLTVKYGFRSYTNIKVGEKTNVSYLIENNKPIKLPFTIRLDKYETKYYPDGIPKSYISKISIIKRHTRVLTKDIKVNHPLTYNGITIYQSSYGHYKPAAARLLVLNLKNRNYKRAIDARPGTFYDLKKENIRFKFTLKKNPKKSEVPFFIAVYNNKNKKDFQKLNFNILPVKNHNHKVPLIFAKYQNTVFLYNGIKNYYYSGVEITKNSYTSVVWVGSIILIIALFFSFFFNQQETWARLMPKNGGEVVGVEILSIPRKKFPSFYRKFGEKIANIKNKLNLI
ncbi:MAG: cytochrome c biogenesis protein ResB [Deltaproteobacteria bacterium]|nr:cytochrome c biogenesis protein ResB [Deltaproteobacteria bacterium]